MAFSKTIRTRYRSFLPGAGYSSSGAAKQGKTNIRGQIQVVDYVRGGTSLTAPELGLDTVDDLTLTLIEPVRSPEPTNQLRSVVYSHTSQEFYVVENLHDFHQFYVGGAVGGPPAGFGGDPVKIGELVEVAGGSDFTLSFDAFGDSAHNVELT